MFADVTAPLVHDLPADPAIRRILLMRWTAMGDVVLSSAAFEDVRRAFPDARIDLHTHRPWERLFAGDRRFARVFALNFRGRARGLAGVRAWLGEARARRYDLIVDLQSNDRSRLLLTALMLSGRRVPWRLGTRQVFPYNIAPPAAPEPVHAYTRNRMALAAGGIQATTTRPVLAIPEAARAGARALLDGAGVATGGHAVFLPGSQAAGYLKRWGAERYAALARLLAAAGVERVLLVGGPDEIEECARIAALAGPGVANLCGRSSLQEVVALCESARCIVANDTGTAHLAAAAGRPMLVICGPTDPRKVRPIGDRVHTLQADLPCINCYRKHCAHHSCMHVVSPEQVLARLTSVP